MRGGSAARRSLRPLTLHPSVRLYHNGGPGGLAGQGLPDCPWDCEQVPNGSVGTTDLLALLAQWGGAGSCDFDGGGVGTTDLLKLLANWGNCP